METVLWKCILENEYTNVSYKYSVFQRFFLFLLLQRLSPNHLQLYFFLPKGNSDTYTLHLSPVLLVTWKCETTSLPKLLPLYTLLITPDFHWHHTSLPTLKNSFPSLSAPGTCLQQPSPQTAAFLCCIKISSFLQFIRKLTRAFRSAQGVWLDSWGKEFGRVKVECLSLVTIY